jgi:hypothetical protein
MRTNLEYGVFVLIRLSSDAGGAGGDAKMACVQTKINLCMCLHFGTLLCSARCFNPDITSSSSISPLWILAAITPRCTWCSGFQAGWSFANSHALYRYAPFFAVCSAGTQQQCELGVDSQLKTNMCCLSNNYCRSQFFCVPASAACILQARSSNASWVLGWQVTHDK